MAATIGRLTGEEEFEAAVTATQNVQQTMQELPIFERFQILMQISDSIKENRNEFATILARESGKPMKTSLIETDRAAHVFLVAAEEAKRLPGEAMSLDWHPSGVNKEVDLDRAVAKAVVGAFSFAGQTCIHTQRIYIEDSVFDEFPEKFCWNVSVISMMLLRWSTTQSLVCKQGSSPITTDISITPSNICMLAVSSLMMYQPSGQITCRTGELKIQALVVKGLNMPSSI